MSVVAHCQNSKIWITLQGVTPVNHQRQWQWPAGLLQRSGIGPQQISIDSCCCCVTCRLRKSWSDCKQVRHNCWFCDTITNENVYCLSSRTTEVMMVTCWLILRHHCDQRQLHSSVKIWNTATVIDFVKLLWLHKSVLHDVACAWKN